MRTLIVSDLHLGSPSRRDALRHPEWRSLLLDELADVERLVLLGDIFELRDGDHEIALNAARPLFRDLDRALSGGEIVITAGNHDHALVAPWLTRAAASARGRPLGIEQIVPSSASPLLEALDGWLERARLTVSYPGVLIREDVYATHGHYLDCHAPLTNGERMLIAASGGALRETRRSMCAVEEYERSIGRLYSRLERTAPLRGVAYSRALARSGRLLTGLRRDRLTRAEAIAMGDVAARLGLGDCHVVFGHTHRAGPWPGEDESQWRGRDGVRLLNCGHWLSDTDPYVSPIEGAMRGTCVAVDDLCAPKVLSLAGPASD